LWKMGELATGGLVPNLTIVLDLPVAEARARRGRPADRMEGKDTAFHERVRAGFLAEAGAQPDKIKVVDAAAAVDEVQARIRREVARVLATNPRP
jgi:dTMP kinase